MNQNIMSFIAGIASGIVSSVIVTLYYRYKDKDRDRQSLFSEIRTYYSLLAHVSYYGGVKELGEFMIKYEMPHIAKWVHLSSDERKIIVDFYESVMKISYQVNSYESLKKDLDIDHEHNNTGFKSKMLGLELEKFDNIGSKSELLKLQLEELDNCVFQMAQISSKLITLGVPKPK